MNVADWVVPFAFPQEISEPRRRENPMDIVARVGHRTSCKPLHRGQVENPFHHGIVHRASVELQTALCADPATFDLWNSLTPLGRNEFICWVEDGKRKATRERRIRRACEELLKGKKRPCCWAAASTAPTSPRASGSRQG